MKLQQKHIIIFLVEVLFPQVEHCDCTNKSQVDFEG